MSKNIVIVATFDTRGDEVEFLKEIIENKGGGCRCHGSTSA
jgi:uncharacterized protein (UPF0261 family)